MVQRPHSRTGFASAVILVKLGTGLTYPISLSPVCRSASLIGFLFRCGMNLLGQYYVDLWDIFSYTLLTYYFIFRSFLLSILSSTPFLRTRLS